MYVLAMTVEVGGHFFHYFVFDIGKKAEKKVGGMKSGGNVDGTRWHVLNDAARESITQSVKNALEVELSKQMIGGRQVSLNLKHRSLSCSKPPESRGGGESDKAEGMARAQKEKVEEEPDEYYQLRIVQYQERYAGLGSLLRDLMLSYTITFLALLYSSHVFIPSLPPSLQYPHPASYIPHPPTHPRTKTGRVHDDGYGRSSHRPPPPLLRHKNCQIIVFFLSLCMLALVPIRGTGKPEFPVAIHKARSSRQVFFPFVRSFLCTTSPTRAPPFYPIQKKYYDAQNFKEESAHQNDDEDGANNGTDMGEETHQKLENGPKNTHPAHHTQHAMNHSALSRFLYIWLHLVLAVCVFFTAAR